MTYLINQANLKRYIEEVWNNGNLTLIDELVSTTYVIHHDPGDPWEGQTLDHEELKKRVLYSRNAFPDLHFAINEFVPGENKVAISWFLTGTHKGDLARVPASGQKIKISGMTIYYFDDDKISGHWQVIDQLAFLAQVGMLGLTGENIEM